MDNEQAQATLDEQFTSFAAFMDSDRNGTTITLYLSDYWMRQSKVLDDRKLTTTDTGLLWMQFNKTELTYEEWHEYLSEVCYLKDIDQQEVECRMTNCGLPGEVTVNVPQYRDFFKTYVPYKMINENINSH